MHCKKCCFANDIANNYWPFANREHAVELSNPVPTEPIIFLKPTTSYIVEGQKIKVMR